MPELPEVETVRRGLEPVLAGHVILRAEVRRPDLRWPFPPGMAARLTGVRVLGLRRRSKYILADLDSGETLIVHLGMSGRLLIAAAGDAVPQPAAGHAAPFAHAGAPGAGAARGAMPGAFVHAQGGMPLHDHVVLTTDAGVRITFNDARRFGAMDLVPTGEAAAHRLLAGLGPEPLGNGFSAAHLIARFRGKRTPVKAALLDQGIVAGLGNIYVCEALHRAGIAPWRHAGRIAAARVERLVPVIRDVLAEAIAAGGSSLRDYRQADGALGYFQHALRAYGRAGQPCPAPGCGGTIRRMVQAGRSTFWCPSCQR
ncbi:MAG: bifunctional DNA-formamidopyrimidine glycosylase/DNA-(apurinic or apyrimidinic site) lyase [Gemmobacter sp.]